jgi:DNA replication protein DnaC
MKKLDFTEAEAALRRAAAAAGKSHLLDVTRDDMFSEDFIGGSEETYAKLRVKGYLSSLPEGLRGMTFDSWEARDGASEQVARAREWSGTGHTCGLFIHSEEPGNGKTHLAVACGRVMAENGHAAAYMNAVSLIEKIKLGFGKEHPAVDVQRIGSMYDALILDDLGAEKPGEWVSQQLYLLVNTAVTNRTRLIVTSNLSYGEIDTALGPRIADRLYGATIELSLDGVSSYRHKQHKENQQCGT